MISKFPGLVGFAAVSLLGGACISSGGGGLSDEEAADRVDAVVAAFEGVADEEGFSEDDDDEEDDDETEFECEAFEAFEDDGETEPIALAALSVTDGGEPEVAGVDADGHITFEGGEVTGQVEVSVIDDDDDLDRAIEALDAVIDDPDAFEECIEGGFAESVAGGQDESFEIDDVDLAVDVAKGDTGDQELVIRLDGSLALSGDGLSVEFLMAGEMRLIRVDRAGLLVAAFSLGDVVTDALEPAIDAAVDEFEAQFG